MKKLAVFMALCAALSLCACSGGKDSNTSAGQTPAVVQQTESPAPTPTPAPTEEPKTYIYASDKSQAGTGWTEVESFSYDIDGDGTKEKLRLMTSAKKDSKGRLVLDDSQEWVIEMQDDGEVFTLFGGRVSNGCPYFEVSSDSGKNCVRVLVSSSSKFIDKNYEFLNDKRAFIETDTPETQNTVYSSIPYYE